MKKGQVWISAALYFGLGVIVITLVLTAGMPVINKLRDRNTIIQTKEIMFVLDDKIREVVRGGAGEQRLVEMEIKKGEFIIDSDNDNIKWSVDSKIIYSEPGETVEEGNLFVNTEESNVIGEYKIVLGLDYSTLDIPTNIEYTGSSQIIKGINRLIIRNDGLVDNKIKVTISNK